MKIFKTSQAVVSPTMLQQMANQQLIASGVPDANSKIAHNFKQLVLEAVKGRVQKNKVLSTYLHSMTPLDLDPEKSEGLVVVSIMFNGNIFYAPYIIKGNRVSEFDCLISRNGAILIPPDEQLLLIASKFLETDPEGWTSDYNLGKSVTHNMVDFPEDIKLGLGQGGQRVLQAGANSFVKTSSDKKRVKDFLLTLSKFSSSDRVQIVLKEAVKAIRKMSLSSMSEVIYFDSSDKVEYIEGIYKNYLDLCAAAGAEPAFTMETVMAEISNKGFFLHVGEDYTANTKVSEMYQDFLQRFGNIDVAPEEVNNKEAIPNPKARLTTVLRKITTDKGYVDFVSDNCLAVANYGKPETLIMSAGSITVTPNHYLKVSPIKTPELSSVLGPNSGLILSYDQLKSLYGDYSNSVELQDPRLAWVKQSPAMSTKILEGSQVILMDLIDNANAKVTDLDFNVATLVMGKVAKIELNRIAEGVTPSDDEVSDMEYRLTILESDSDKEVKVVFALGGHPQTFSSIFGRNSQNNIIRMDLRTTIATIVDSFEKDDSKIEELGILSSKEQLANYFVESMQGSLLKVSWAHSDKMVEIQIGSHYGPREVWSYSEFAGVCAEHGWDFKKISAATIQSGLPKGKKTFVVTDKEKTKKVSFATAPGGFYSATMDVVGSPATNAMQPLERGIRETYVEAALVPWLNELAMETSETELSPDLLELVSNIDSELLRSLSMIGSVVLRLYTNEDSVKSLIGIDSWDNLVTTGKNMFNKLSKYGLAIIEFVNTIRQ